MHFRSQAKRGACTVKGSKSPADDYNLITFLHRYRFAFHFFTPVGNSVYHPISIFTRNSHFVTRPAPDTEVHGVKALREQVINGKVLPQFNVILFVYTQIPNMLDFTVHHVLLQTIFRNPIAQHATWLRL